jgi:hypothetical protein
MDGGQLFYNYFSFSAKKAIFRASEICQQFSNQFVEPEHILFSILQLRSSSAMQVLQRLNVNLPKLTFSLEAELYSHAGNFKGNNAFSARALALLDSSFREVKKLNHKEIGTTHLLLALASERSPALRELFDEHRLDAKRIREAFVQHLLETGPTAGPHHGGGSRRPHSTPAGNEAITIGGVAFVSGKTFYAHTLQFLAAASRLAMVQRQPEVTPAELLDAMVHSAGKGFFDAAFLLKLDTPAFQYRLAEHWLATALPLGTELKDPPERRFGRSTRTGGGRHDQRGSYGHAASTGVSGTPAPGDARRADGPCFRLSGAAVQD